MGPVGGRPTQDKSPEEWGRRPWIKGDQDLPVLVWLGQLMDNRNTWALVPPRL